MRDLRSAFFFALLPTLQACAGTSPVAPETTNRDGGSAVLPEADAGADPGSAVDASSAVDAAPVPPADAAVSSDAGAVAALPYGRVTQATTTLGSDPADVYVPEVAAGVRLPLALMLQGAKVGREHLRVFAGEVAKWGFVVLVPDHRRSFFGQNDLFAEQQEVTAAAAWAKAQAQQGAGAGAAIDASKLVLLGHSFGGVTGLNAIQGGCAFPLCSGTYTKPAELLGGVFYGTNTKPPGGFGSPSAVATAGLGVGYVQGALDGKALPVDGRTTYDQTSGGRKAYVTVAGANHYAITDANPPAGADADPTAPTLDQATAQLRTGRVTGLLLRWVTLKEESAKALLQAESANGVTITTAN